MRCLGGGVRKNGRGRKDESMYVLFPIPEGFMVDKIIIKINIRR